MHLQLKALGQCIPPPRHILPAPWSVSRSMLWIATKI